MTKKNSDYSYLGNKDQKITSGTIKTSEIRWEYYPRIFRYVKII